MKNQMIVVANWVRQVILPLVLLGLGFLLIWKSKTDAGWIGVTLIGLALFYRLIEGRKLSSFGFGPDGVSVSLLEERIDQVEKKADAAAEAGKQPDLSIQSPKKQICVVDGMWSDPKDRIIAQAPENDLQKNQWGKAAKRNGRVLLGYVEETSNNPELFWVRLIVRPVDNAPPIQSPVKFHLHQTFPKTVVQVRSQGGEAHLERYAYGAFTVGVEVMDEPNTFLELDLANLSTAPKLFRDR